MQSKSQTVEINPAPFLQNVKVGLGAWVEWLVSTRAVRCKGCWASIKATVRHMAITYGGYRNYIQHDRYCKSCTDQIKGRLHSDLKAIADQFAKQAGLVTGA